MSAGHARSSTPSLRRKRMPFFNRRGVSGRRICRMPGPELNDELNDELRANCAPAMGVEEMGVEEMGVEEGAPAGVLLEFGVGSGSAASIASGSVACSSLMRPPQACRGGA